MKVKFLQAFDFVLFFCVICLVTLGVLFIYSSGINSRGVNTSSEYVKQIIWASVGIVIMVIISLLDYRRIHRYIPRIFIVMCGILFLTRIFGKYVNGAKSWIGIGPFGIQPSEFSKIAFVLFLAWFLERSAHYKDQRKRFILAIGILLLPVGLIMSQPDLGTALVFFPIFLIMCFIAGVPTRYVLMIFFGGLLTILFIVLPIWESEIFQSSVPVLKVLTNTKLRLIVFFATGSISIIGVLGQIFYRDNRVFYWISYIFGIICFALVFSYAGGKVLKTHQIQRLIVFIDPYKDPQGAGWHIIQSKIAIGSGSLFGNGYLKGTQSHYQFLPEQSTDFIFSILSEEFGFVGCMCVFALYFIILMRTVFIIKKTSNTFGLLIASGILGLFFFHFIENVGMAMGIMPITGIPLLFVSYGGSSLWTAMICVGLLMSISSRKYNDFVE